MTRDQEPPESIHLRNEDVKPPVLAINRNTMRELYRTISKVELL